MDFELSFDVKELKKYRWLVPYLVLGLAVLFGINIFRARFNKIKQLRTKVADKKEAISRLQQRVSQIESISASEVEGRISTVLYALPQTKDPVLILSTAKGLAVDSGLLIDEISFAPGKISLEEEENKNTNLDSITVNFALSGQMEDLNKFIQKIPDASPLLNLNGFSIQWKEGRPQFSLTVESYYSYVNRASFPQKTEVTLTAAEDKIYQQIAALEKFGEGIVVEKEEFESADKTRNPFLRQESKTVEQTKQSETVINQSEKTPED